MSSFEIKTRIGSRIEEGFKGITLEGQPAPVKMIGLVPGEILGRIIPSGSRDKKGRLIPVLVVPSNLKAKIDVLAAEGVIVPPEITQALNIAIQASHF
ncbi:MAG: hypothetical protein UR56_C0003G0041 [Candidatus Roizmanbacteria bacterium GW2011_GWC2_34_23]|uniref:Uncharacterized protein n=1 Tax=Candidatus Roizmanbacteria bacterium GW2011_GWC2_34_23 TaxID=1618484 RepID=A0A0G0B0T4_9BACT|nr:MAG: hypothetical protein UR56_C0003G0041 [Candidatus Roizmanbacteria bacterium GW2011_GWC2_34_23]